MRNLQVALLSTSPKMHLPKLWKDVDGDIYLIDGQEYIKVYLTRHQLEHNRFSLDDGKIIIGNQIYTINAVTFDEKRPKYANCLVSKDDTFKKEALH